MKVCFDSRLIKKGEHFVPIKGDSFDGHDFIQQALSNGAEGIIEVEELFKLAQEKLQKVNPTVIGIAGSVGKSTFRTYLVQILSYKYKVLDGSLNTKLGLASNIINSLDNQQIFVAELGIDRLGEMQIVTEFLQPTFSVITKLEKEHLQFLLSIENVIEENLVAIVNSKEKLGYINEKDRSLVKGYEKNVRLTYFPFDEVDIVRLIMEANHLNVIDFPLHELEYLNCIYQIVSEKFGFSEDEFIGALQSIKKPNGRLNIIDGVNGSVIIDDTYNAVADASVIEGIKFALSYQNSMLNEQNLKKDLTIILSSMRENGDSAEEQHKKVAEFLKTVNYKKLYLVGDDKKLYSKWMKTDFISLSSYAEIQISASAQDLFYVKGSQFYRLEKVVENLMKYPEKASELLVRQDARWK